MNLSTFTPQRRGLHCLLLWVALLAGTAGLRAQNVNVTGALVGNGTYATLGAAFTAINGGAQGGANIQITVVNNTNEGTTTAALNQSSTPWATLSIQPSGGSWTISGATTAGSPMIDFNGADNVTVDGLNSSGNALTISNTTVSATSLTSTIRFQGDATNNTITRCTVLGSSTMSTTTNGGTIYFGAAAVTTGNDNNTISFCNIGPAGSNLPAKAIYSNGSTTTTTTFNSGIQLINNNIFDFFHASAQSNGVYLAGGNSDWTVSNNRLYQTATRTQTTGAIHAGIQLASSGITNVTVSNNVIGFASSAGTGTYTLAGVSSTRFFPLFVTLNSSTTASSFTGNTITNIAMTGAISGTTTSSPFTGLSIGSSGGLVNFNNNIIGSQVTNGAISITSSSTSASEIYGMFNNGSSAMTANGNIIGGINMTNSSTGAINFIGLRVNTSSTVNATLQNNQIGGAVTNSILCTTTSTNSSVIGINVTIPNSIVTGNTIGSMTTTLGNGTGTTPSVGGIVIAASSANHTVTGNNIGALTNAGASATGHVSGIVIGSSTGPNLVDKNLIHSLVAAGAGATINGIFVSAGTNTFQNNMIRLGVDPLGAAITTGCLINGINETTAGTDNFYHNSVYIGGSGVGGSANTFAFQSSITTNTRNYQNNIFYNARSNGAGTGKHYAIRVGGTAPNPAGLTSNYNVLLSNGTGGFVGLFNAVDQATIANWRTATGQDNNSLNLDPNFVAPNGTAVSVDLHIANPTPIESNGTPIAAVTDDYDGQTRSGLTPVDIGADAGNFTGSVDLAAPSISYTALVPVCNTLDRVLTATITDLTGVPTSGPLQPRIYFKKNAGAYVSTQGVLASGTATSGTWNFTISTAALGGLVPGDVVSYFVIAQDVVGPYISSNPSAGLVATDVNTVTTPPTSPNSYNVAYNLNGTYTVGATGNFPTITAAVNAYNTGCLSGPVIFSLIDASYTTGETFPITILNNAAASSVNTLTIKPTLANTVISGSSATSIFRLNGSTYVTIDGSISNTTNSFCPPVTAASRDLSITNTSTASLTAVVWVSSAGAGLGATNCTVKNCVVSNGVDQSTTGTENFGILTCGSTIVTAPSSDGLGNNNLLIENNAILKATWGIYLRGGASSSNTGNIVRQNLVGPAAFGVNEIRKGGIIVENQDGVNITGNEVRFVGNQFAQGVSGTDHIGIGVGGHDGPTPTTYNVTNGVITHNSVHDIVDEKTFSAIGIILAVNGASASNNLIANNMVSNVRSNGTSGDQGIGIDVANGNGDRVVYNTVSMVSADRDPSGATSAGESDMGVRFQAGAVNQLFKDNIVYVDEASNTSSLKNYDIVVPTASYPWGTGSCNYNNYGINASSTQNNRFGTGTTGTITAVTTIAAWQTGFTPNQDLNSTQIAPVFASATDLHLPPSSNGSLDNLGSPVSGVTTDIDCGTRSASTPDMGADEFVINAPIIAYTPLTSDCNTGDKVFTATISDVEGVPTSGAFQPRVYFKKNAGSYFSTQGVLTSGSSTSGTWTFTISAAAMGGLVNNDVVSYYVIAQDIVAIPNVGANPGTGLVASDVNTVTTHPTTPNTVTVNPTLSGTYTVGATGNFTTLTAAVNTYNNACLAGPVIFSLIDATYPGETFPITINANTAASSTNTLTIKPATGVTPTLTGSNAVAIIKINGGDFITLDGSNNGTTSRDWTVSNSNTGTTSAVIWGNSVNSSNGATNITVKNLIVAGNASTTTNVGIGFSGSTLGSVAEVANNNVTIQNNAVTASFYGIFKVGPTGNETGTVISGNTVGSSVGASKIGWQGISVFQQSGVQINDNIVLGITYPSSSVLPAGIAINGTQSGGSVLRNKITDIKNTNSSSFGAAGLLLNSSSAGIGMTIANNFVSDVTGVGFNGTALNDNGQGIAVNSGGGYNIYFNSVNLGTNQSTNGNCAALWLSSSLPAGAVDLQQNILANTQTAGVQRYAVYTAATSNALFSTMNYNDYYSAGANIGSINAVNYTNIAGMQTGFGGNASSRNIAPVFTSATDLHLIPASNATLNDLGIVVGGITTDIDGDTRSASTDMGADEFTLPLCSGTPTPGTAVLTSSSICANAPASISISGFSPNSGLSFQWQASFVPGGPYTPIPGATATSYTGTLPAPGVYYITCLVTCTNGGASAVSNEVTLTVRPFPTVTVSPVSSSICTPSGTPVSLTASSTGGTAPVTYTWAPTTGLTPTSGSPVSANPTVTTVYTVTGTDATGCLSTATATVNVGAVVTGLTASATPSTLCSGGNSQLSASATFTYNASNYIFSTSTGATLDPMTGATTVIGNSIDDTPTAAPASIGFNFVYEGTTYTQYSVSPDGWILLGGATATSEFTNAVTSATNVPRLYPYWDDLATGTDGNVKTLVTGTAPNRIFKVQWFINIPRSVSGPANSTFQAWLYENGGRIEYRYGTMGAPVGTISGGITGATSSNFNSLTFSSNTSSAGTANDNNAIAPASGRMYTYAVPQLSWSWSPSTFITGQTTLSNPLATAMTSSTTYTVVATTPAGCTATTTVPVTVNANVTPTISITANPGNVICAGTSVTFTAVATDGGAVPVYQWKKNGGNVGTNSTTYTDAALANGDVITCTLTSNAACASPATVVSNSISMTVNPLVTPSVSISANPGTTVCAGTNVTFTATPTNGGATPSYQWFKNASPVGTNSATYSDNALASSDVITCTLTSNATCASPTTANSNSITMTVNPLLTPSVSIGANPGNVICAGTNVTFTATTVNGGASPSYQWLVNGSPVGTNSATYSSSTLANGDVVTVSLTSNATCASPATVTSNAITMTVNPLLTPSVTIAANPGTTICAGTNVTFTATPVNGGSTPAYQWRINGSPVGTNSATFSSSTLVNGDVVTVDLTSNALCATPTSATSNALTMTVNPLLTPSVTIAANPGTTICAGTSVTFTATDINGGASPSYQWFVNGSPVGTNSATYTSSTLANGDVVTVDLTSNATCASPTTVTSNALTMTVNPVVTPTLTISASPGTTICAGTNITFTAVATNGGGSPVYQWRKNGGAVGTNSNTYSNALLGNGDVITCEITSSDPCASPAFVTSNTLTISVVTNVTPTVSIAVSPGTTICPGSSATFTATAVNSGMTPSYQWQVNSSNVGTNSATYTSSSLVTGDNVTCIVTSSDPCALPTTATSNTITMTVADFTPPTAVCQNLTVSLNASGNASTTAAAVNNGSSDNCTASGSLSLSLSQTSFTCANLGANTVTLSVTDAASNIGNCNATITVVDAILPTISCPANQSATTGVGVCTANVTYSTPVGADNCSATTTRTTGQASGTAFPLGVTTNTFQATDASGNSATCSFTVTVTDGQLPTITCPANQSVPATVGACSATATYTAPVGADNCSGATTVQTAGLASGATYPLGATTNTFRVTDGAGNSTTCSFTVTVTDGQLPTITCPANQSVPATVGACSATATYTAPVGADNCTGATTAQTAGLASGATFPVGVTTNTFRVTDGAGNTATCSFTVTVTDGQLPTITCPANQSVPATSGACSATATYTAPVGADNCSGATTVQTAGLASGATYPLGATTNTFRVTDGAGNSTTCSFTVTVTDNQLPTITCPANQTVSATVGACSATVTYTAPVGADNCTGATTALTSGLASGATYPLGSTLNTFRVTDGAGNTATCSFSITVTDNQLPTITCPANQSVNAATGLCSATVTYTAPVGADNCTGATTLQIAGNASGASFPIGATTNTFRVTDGAGNSATCSFTVTVTDSEAPVITCPANQTVNSGAAICGAVASYSAPVGTDNCTGASTTQTAGLGSGATYPLGVTTNTFSVVDASSNTASCSFTVTVVDVTAPVAVCQNTSVTLDSTGNASTNTGAIDNGSSDNCSVASTSLSQTAFTCANAGANTVVLTVTDGSGNTATCSAIVTVIAPAVTGSAVADTTTCGYNVSCNGGNDGVAHVTAGGGCPSYTYLWDNGDTSATATGLGAGIHTVTITDGVGGTQVASVTLTEPSVITAVDNATQTCTGDSTGTVDLTVTGGNDCAPYTFAWSNGATTEDLSGLMAGTYTVTVTDISGCSTTHTVTVGNFAVPAPTFTQSGNLLTAGQVWVTYQWLLNGNAIPGANASTYLLSVDGDYSLQVTDANGCSATTAPSTIVSVDDPMSDLLDLSIYPNPARGEFRLRTANPIAYGLTVTITDMYGKRVISQVMQDLGHETTFNISGYTAGTYMVDVTTEYGQHRVFKLVIQ